MKNKKSENFWLNLGCNIIAPSLLLVKGRSIIERFGFECSNIDFWVFLVAMAFPIFYGIFDFVSRKKWNLFSVIGFVSVLLTGGVGLLSLSKDWIIVKEGAVPLLLGIAVLITAYTKRPLAKMIIMSDSVFDVEKIENSLLERGTKKQFNLQMKGITYIVAGSFLLSSILNFLLAYFIIKSPSGTQEFNAELGTMTALSYPVIVLPTMVIFIFAMFKFFKTLKNLTGLELEDVMLKK